MRLASGVLEGVDTVAPASSKVVPTDGEVLHLNQDYCQQLEEHLRQEDHRQKKKIPHTGDTNSAPRRRRRRH